MQSDEALYERLCAGDIVAFDELYDRYERRLFGFLCVQLHDRSEAEDVMHETFLAILRQRDQGRGIESFRAWIYQVARNLCLNRVRSRGRGARAVEQAAQAPASGPVHPEDALDRCEQAEALRAAVRRLPEQLAELYQLRAAGLSFDELAQVLAVPVGTVKSRSHEMIRRLREELQR